MESHSAIQGSSSNPENFDDGLQLSMRNITLSPEEDFDLYMARRKAKQKEEREAAIEDSKRRKREREEKEAKPKSLEEMHKTMRPPYSADVTRTFFAHFSYSTSRSDPLLPETRNISQADVGRMKMLIDTYPGGVTVDYFLELYAQIHGKPKLNGYRFPKDDDPSTGFKLPSAFWIPCNQACHVPNRIIFPVKSFKKYDGSLKTVLEDYWHRFLLHMQNGKLNVVNLTGIDDCEALLLVRAGVWFNYKHWGLVHYVQFFEILLENFDPNQEKYEIQSPFSEDDRGWGREKKVYVVSTKDDFAKKFRLALFNKFNKPLKVKKEDVYVPIKQHIPWSYCKMNFEAVEKLHEKRSSSRIGKVVTAGNIWNFNLFFVILVDDIGMQDELLRRIHEIVVKDPKFTVPDPTLIEKNRLVMFSSSTVSKPMWRRGLVLGFNKTDLTITVLDIDTGETSFNVHVDTLRNFTPTLFYFPVFAIPVRFSVYGKRQNLFLGNPEGNFVLGKYLHMMLVGANRGMCLKFHRWDETCNKDIPGVWVTSGYLINILEDKGIESQVPFPKVSISSYLLEKFEKRRMNEVLPVWPEELDEDNWGSTSNCDMPRRLPNIEAMIRLYLLLVTGPRHQSENLEIPVTCPTELEIDRSLVDTPEASIFVDDEYIAWKQRRNRRIKLPPGKKEAQLEYLKKLRGLEYHRVA